MSKTVQKSGIVWLLLVGIVASALSCHSRETQSGAPAATNTLIVSAASSLTDAMNEIGPAFCKENPNTAVRFNFAASGPLQQQIEQGAPVDVFASASTKEMDALQKGSLLEPETRITFAGNTLVLIARPGSSIRTWEDLKSPSVRKVAISSPDSVPSGRYAKETLSRRGLWTSVTPKAVFGENVRQTLSYIANGDVDAGMVFATDAVLEQKKVRVVAEAAAGTDHKPIVYPAAVVSRSLHKDLAKRFVRFLQGPSAQAILAKYGFRPAGGQK